MCAPKTSENTLSFHPKDFAANRCRRGFRTPELRATQDSFGQQAIFEGLLFSFRRYRTERDCTEFASSGGCGQFVLRFKKEAQLQK